MILTCFLINKAMINYKIITPAGCIITESIEVAKDYKSLYGWPYVVIRDEEENKPINTES